MAKAAISLRAFIGSLRGLRSVGRGYSALVPASFG